jgi:hypothetical protein
LEGLVEKSAGKTDGHWMIADYPQSLSIEVGQLLSL